MKGTHTCLHMQAMPSGYEVIVTSSDQRYIKTLKTCVISEYGFYGSSASKLTQTWPRPILLL